ncbi:MAG: hypothetical protein H7A21_07885 [Spirochaetales bacterium]|nr:hypothetical protein [Leptospiraceae bacterium]MCP5481335.1 hypothetical protein [Spirochaetales bacterium]MCP5485773.1 hypothetical protein [Spirochaetales bacterium]
MTVRIPLGIILGLSLLAPHALGAVSFGIVRDFNSLSNEVTVVTPSPGILRPGQTAYVFRGRQPVGQIRVRVAWHTRVQCERVQGHAPASDDIVLLRPSDLNALLGEEMRVVSFERVGTEAAGWISRVSFEADSEEQIRKLTIARNFGARLVGDDFYTDVATAEVARLEYRWDTLRLRGTAILLKNGRRLECEEILTPGIFRALRPPAAVRDREQGVTVFLESESNPVTERPDAITVRLDVETPREALGSASAYLLKIYTNGFFVQRFPIGPDLLAQARFQTSFQFPGMQLAPGANHLVFTIAPEQTDPRFGEARTAGEVTIQYGEVQFEHEFRLVGEDGDFPELAE